MGLLKWRSSVLFITGHNLGKHTSGLRKSAAGPNTQTEAAEARLEEYGGRPGPRWKAVGKWSEETPEEGDFGGASISRYRN